MSVTMTTNYSNKYVTDLLLFWVNVGQERVENEWSQ
jgi:hypothetical protein